MSDQRYFTDDEWRAYKQGLYDTGERWNPRVADLMAYVDTLRAQLAQAEARAAAYRAALEAIVSDDRDEYMAAHCIEPVIGKWMVHECQPIARHALDALADASEGG